MYSSLSMVVIPDFSVLASTFRSRVDLRDYNLNQWGVPSFVAEMLDLASWPLRDEVVHVMDFDFESSVVIIATMTLQTRLCDRKPNFVSHNRVCAPTVTHKFRSGRLL